MFCENYWFSQCECVCVQSAAVVIFLRATLTCLNRVELLYYLENRQYMSEKGVKRLGL